MLEGEAKAYKATLVAVISEVILLFLKVVVGIIIASLSILAEALDSVLDLAASLLMFFLLRQAALPPDDDHPYGHGKYDAIASLFQASLMTGFSGAIFYEAIKKMIYNLPVKFPELGIGVMLVKLVFRVLLINYYSKIYKRTGSLSILSLAGNYKGDLFNAFGIIFGLLIVKLSGIYIFDPLVALAIASFYLRTAINIYKKAFHQIVDKAPQEVYGKVEKLLMEHYPSLVGFHKLRVRETGNSLQMDMHILLPNGISLEEAHDLAEHLESDIKGIFPSSVVVIHMEPERKNVQKDLEGKKTGQR